MTAKVWPPGPGFMNTGTALRRYAVFNDVPMERRNQLCAAIERVLPYIRRLLSRDNPDSIVIWFSAMRSFGIDRSAIQVYRIAYTLIEAEGKPGGIKISPSNIATLKERLARFRMDSGLETTARRIADACAASATWRVKHRGEA